MTEQKPVAWSYSWAFGEVLTRYDPTARAAVDRLRNIRPLYEHPAPQPATDPAVEAARRKALRGVLALLDSYPWACDTAPVQGDVTFGVLRDLVGQPRKYPDRAVRGYDNDGPPGPHPVFGKREPEPLQPSPGVQAIAETLFAGADDFWARGKKWQTANRVQRASAIARATAVHALVYGKDAE